MFERIVHADWSLHPPGRWFASARRTRAGWRAEAPRPVGDVAAFVDGIVASGRTRPTLAAFDFPIGLPSAYAAATGFASFRQALDAFGGPGWERWFEPAAAASEIALGRPFYPAKPGSAKVRHLLDGLGVETVAALTRETERGGAGLRPAGCMFWLVGAKTVGKAAIHGWQEVVRPALARGAALWPFDGDLDRLAAGGAPVLAESYPADAARMLGLTVVGKGRPAVLEALAPAILAAAASRGVALSADLARDVSGGFATCRGHCGDAFDAVVGLLAAIAVADGAPDGAPGTAPVRDREGWILGRRAAGGIPPQANAFPAGGPD